MELIISDNSFSRKWKRVNKTVGTSRAGGATKYLKEFMSTSSEAPDEESGEADYKTLALNFKDQGNKRFQEGSIDEAIDFYTQAISLDPDNEVFYSNRSAAYMKADSKSKALRDGVKCVELAPKWSKGYNRLGVAQQSLRRFEQAIDSFQKGIELDSSNKALWAALRCCKDAFEEDKKARYATASNERARTEQQEELIHAHKEQQQATKVEKSTESSGLDNQEKNDSPGVVVTKPPDEEDLLAGFFTEVKEVTEKAEVAKEVLLNNAAISDPEKIPSAKYTNQELGTSLEQHLRLTGKFCEWSNLNPYFVLSLDVDATGEDIKTRYRKLAARVHPDKLKQTGENADLAFQAVKTAYQTLCDEREKASVIMNIKAVRERISKEHKKLLSKGASEESLPDLEEQIQKATLKQFADIEMARRKSESLLRGYSAREKYQEEEEKEFMKAIAEEDKQWAEVDRREKRVDSWRGFQTDPSAKKAKLNSYKEQTRETGKYAQVELETWKKNWK